MLSPPTAIAATASLAMAENFSPDLRDLVGPSGQRRLRNLLKAVLRGRALVRDRFDRPLRRLVDLAAHRAGGFVDEGAQLRVARVEMLRPNGAGRVQDGARVIGLGGQGGVSRSLDAASASSSVCPRTTTVSCNRSDASPSREARSSPCDEHRLGKSAAGAVDAIDDVLAPFAEISGHRFAGRGQARRHGLAVQPNRFGGLSAAGLDAVDQVVVARADLRDEGFAGRPDFLIDVGRAGGDVFALFAEISGHRFAGRGQARRYGRAVQAELLRRLERRWPRCGRLGRRCAR